MLSTKYVLNIKPTMIVFIHGLCKLEFEAQDQVKNYEVVYENEVFLYENDFFKLQLT